MKANNIIPLNDFASSLELVAGKGVSPASLAITNFLLQSRKPSHIANLQTRTIYSPAF